jgi:hypothetical protein
MMHLSTVEQLAGAAVKRGAASKNDFRYSTPATLAIPATHERERASKIGGDE